MSYRPEHYPTIAYHNEYTQGRLFKNVAEFDVADDGLYSDSPANIVHEGETPEIVEEPTVIVEEPKKRGRRRK